MVVEEGVGQSTIFSWKQLALSTPTKPDGACSLPSPKRPKKRPSPAIPEALDSFHLDALRGIVHGYFRKNEGPTLLKVLEDVHSDASFPKVSRSTLWRALQNLGFRFKKRGRNSTLLERTVFILGRAQYLRDGLVDNASDRFVIETDEDSTTDSSDDEDMGCDTLEWTLRNVRKPDVRVTKFTQCIGRNFLYNAFDLYVQASTNAL
ncbi:hypothetical protein HPB47_024531 [Ixodes persulcatus]|uniref:Uncharacterized protein n=1 Tax=Ixodes persulcatus TaxID=34615 RepID=A0AC60Q431_IXOPE|nr:hypothetical protein HPB47_024531 [Ixodes persulcatus]